MFHYWYQHRTYENDKINHRSDKRTCACCLKLKCWSPVFLLRIRVISVHSVKNVSYFIWRYSWLSGYHLGEMYLVILVQILDEVVSISHSAYTLGKVMKATIPHPPSYGLIVEQTGLFNLGMASSLGEENSEFNWILFENWACVYIYILYIYMYICIYIYI